MWRVSKKMIHFISGEYGAPDYPKTRTCNNCEKLGVLDSSNVYVMCNECMDWKIKLQEKLGQ